jgi:hypothetical protein
MEIPHVDMSGRMGITKGFCGKFDGTTRETENKEVLEKYYGVAEKVNNVADNYIQHDNKVGDIYQDVDPQMGKILLRNVFMTEGGALDARVEYDPNTRRPLKMWHEDENSTHLGREEWYPDGTLKSLYEMRRHDGVTEVVDVNFDKSKNAIYYEERFILNGENVDMGPKDK